MQMYSQYAVDLIATLDAPVEDADGVDAQDISAFTDDQDISAVDQTGTG